MGESGFYNNCAAAPSRFSTAPHRCGPMEYWFEGAALMVCRVSITSHATAFCSNRMTSFIFIILLARVKENCPRQLHSFSFPTLLGINKKWNTRYCFADRCCLSDLWNRSADSSLPRPGSRNSFHASSLKCNIDFEQAESVACSCSTWGRWILTKLNYSWKGFIAFVAIYLSTEWLCIRDVSYQLQPLTKSMCKRKSNFFRFWLA